jgi:DNA-binding transcriptional LysR family regulator
MNELALSSVIQDPKGLLSGQYWGELRIFAEVARAKSFNRAAERLGVSQPTIARKVRRLQDLIGAQLFVATKHGVRLTQRGDELAAALVAFDQSLFAIASDLKARAQDVEGIVSVSITDGLGAVFAAPAIPAFETRHPKIQLHLRNIGNLNDLRENQTDMMLTFAPVARADLTCEPLGVLHLLPIATQGYIAKYGLPTRETIGEHRFIQSRLYQPEAPVWHSWQALCAKARVTHFCDNSFAYAMIVRQSLGIGLLGSYTLREKSAVPLHLGVHAMLPIYAVALTERLESRPVRLVYDWICGLFGDTNPWFQRGLALSDLPGTLPAIDMLTEC